MDINFIQWQSFLFSWFSISSSRAAIHLFWLLYGDGIASRKLVFLQLFDLLDFQATWTAIFSLRSVIGVAKEDQIKIYSLLISVAKWLSESSLSEALLFFL